MSAREEGARAQRLFFALWPAAALQQHVAKLLAQLDLPKGRSVAAGNLHVTLEFLGSVGAADRRCAEVVADQIAAPSFELCLDTLGYWSRPQVLWLGTKQVPEALSALSAHLRAGLQGCGFKLDERPYQPHMTVRRDVRRAASLPPIEPMHWPVAGFALVESLTPARGAEYLVLRRWET